MKKVIRIFNKKKRTAVISDAIASDAVPEAPRDIPRYVTKRCDLYNNSNSTKRSEANSVEIQNAEESSNANEHSHDSPDVDEEILTNAELDLESGSTDNNITPESSPSDSILECADVSTATNVSGGNDNEPGNAVALQDRSVASVSHSGISTKRIGGEKKNSGNTYMITISNSRHFHIGSQKTINYSSAENNNLKQKDLKLDVGVGKLLPLESNDALDIKDVVSEDDMLLISLSVRDKWRDFARNLGTDEAIIRELEDLNDKDYNLIVYDILKQYLSRYPNTTVGFIVSVLQRSNEIEAVRKLVDKR